MNPVSLRQLNQQLAAPQFTEPEHVVSYFGAMQAQEYRLMRWAVAMRTKKPSLTSFQNAYNDGRIVRLHLMRGTWQLIPGEDYCWMLDLFATKAKSVIKGWMSANKISIPDKELYSIRDILIQTAENRSVTKEDFKLALESKNSTMDDHRVSYHIRFAELDGILCSGDLLPMKATYTLSENKIQTQQKIDRDEALVRLTKKYFQSHQPATFNDFLWWSGLNVSDCRKGIEMLHNELHVEKWKDQTFYITDSCRTRGVKKDEFILLPSYDEYLIGYKSREIVLAEDFRHRAHNNSGNFYPIILHNGIVCGNWKPFEKDLTADFFNPQAESENLQKEWRRYLQFQQDGNISRNFVTKHL